ncbi:MAG: hypothetical protein JRI95_13010 [Deltaproteobacteria bacterium]|nr:hypothetical protein [Deltaproteobacteria bacterium]MBW2085701.1 hypothetical protein [Deltaproteobacteria bacterium]
MSGQWKEVVRLAFKGSRFRDHALDLTAITELSRFQKIVAETAKAHWRIAHPDRERLPKRFEERTRLCLRRIEEGSAVAPLEVFIEEPEQEELFEQQATEIKEAIEQVHQVFQAVEKNELLPDNFPKALVSDYEQLGQGLADDETIEVVPVGKEPTHITPSTRSHLATFAEVGYADHIDITGEVLEADVRQGRFQVWLDEKTGVTVTFSQEQESEVTTALRDHQTIRIQIIGSGEFSPQGKPLRITQVEKLQLLDVGEITYDNTARPIEDILAELASEIPEEDWNKLPSDLTDHLDHYLYGTPKR